MNATSNVHTLNRPRDDRRNVNNNTPQVRHPYPSRDFGVGYGRSSGYATGRSYTGRTFTPLYACA
ncbi:hypothetical protein [Marilutibacter alkalisoli]|uniref:Uncharacterized protein n=1 Tax=Marilutibacter alkalisoli TaxID=2591633 RepID=A0A514BVP3_9GAMM|nr:hypothetical protein [Lysobacter alkalisoli]QDH71446.1 hypothetical protein FKV23_16095 [Lysobacter alkalisoli]